MIRRLIYLLFASLFIVQVSSPAAWAQTDAAPPIPGVKGKLQSVTSNSLEVMTPTGPVQVKIKQPLTTYGRVPSDLNHVTSSSFVGVTSVKQSNGAEVAQEIHIFPAELRGAGEGSNPLPAASGTASQSRMTNGSVSMPATQASRMTNGTVQTQGNGKTIVVRYQNGQQTITVPPNVQVTEIVPKKETLAPGDTIYAATHKGPDGTLTTDKVYLIAGNTGSK